MGAGRAYGVNRDYQILCRDVLCRMREEDRLRPYQGDGIDVSLLLSGTVRTFDVALVDKHDRIIAAECKRTSNPVKLSDLDTFAHRIELIRKEMGKEVAGAYFAKTGYQLGAIKAGEHEGYQVVVCNQDQTPSSFVLAFERYDADRERRYRQGVGYSTFEIRSQLSVSAVIVRADGTKEDLGLLS